MTGASTATLGELLGSETIAASDLQVARIDELQFDLSEGPCWDALAQMRPMLEPDVRVHDGRWPAFSAALQNENVGAIFAFFPMTWNAAGRRSRSVQHWNPARSARFFVAPCDGTTAPSRMYRAGPCAVPALRGRGRGHARRTIHQATGFVIAQLGALAEDAICCCRGRHFRRDAP